MIEKIYKYSTFGLASDARRMCILTPLYKSSRMPIYGSCNNAVVLDLLSAYFCFGIQRQGLFEVDEVFAEAADESSKAEASKESQEASLVFCCHSLRNWLGVISSIVSLIRGIAKFKSGPTIDT